MHLVRAVVDPSATRLRQHPRERRLVRQTARAVHLHRAVDDLVQHPSGVELERRDLDARLGALVDLPWSSSLKARGYCVSLSELITRWNAGRYAAASFSGATEMT